LAILLPGTAVADPVPPTFPILSQPVFNGVVNGKISDATVYIAAQAGHQPHRIPG